MTRLKCYACDRKLSPNPYVADTRDSQWVYVGSECFNKIWKAKDAGWQPPKGGPRLYPLPRNLTQAQLEEGRIHADEYMKSLRGPK